MQVNKDLEIFQYIQQTETNKNNIFADKTGDISKKIEQNKNNVTLNQNTADNTAQIYNENKQNEEAINNFNSIKRKKKIFKRENPVFKVNKLGRPLKYKIKHKDMGKGRFRKINVTPKIFNACKKNMHSYIQIKFKEADLKEPDINQNGPKDISYWRETSNKTIYEIYCNQIPKRFKGDTKIKEKEKTKERIKERKELYNQTNYNKKQIDEKLEKDGSYKLFKILRFKDFLKPYLRNKTRIIKLTEFGLIELKLKGFETYSQFCNYEFSKEQKEEYKNHVLGIINGTVKDRKKAEK